MHPPISCFRRFIPGASQFGRFVRESGNGNWNSTWNMSSGNRIVTSTSICPPVRSSRNHNNGRQCRSWRSAPNTNGLIPNGCLIGMWQSDRGTRIPRIPFLIRRSTRGLFLYLPIHCLLEPDSCVRARAGFWDWCLAEEHPRFGRRRLDWMWHIRNGSMSRGRFPAISIPPLMGHTMPLSIWGPSASNSCFSRILKTLRSSQPFFVESWLNQTNETNSDEPD